MAVLLAGRPSSVLASAESVAQSVTSRSAGDSRVEYVVATADCVPIRGSSTTGAGTEWRALLALDFALRVWIFGKRQRCTPVHSWLFLSSYSKTAA